MVGSSSTSRLTPRACSSASAARVRSPGDSVPGRAQHVLGAEAELGQQGAHLGVGQSGTSAPNASSSGCRPDEQPAGLVDLADHDARAERAPCPRRAASRPSSTASSVDLPDPFGAGDRDPVGPVDLQVDRAEREVAAADDGAAQRRHDGARPRGGGDLHPQLPLLAGLLDDLQPLDQPLGLPGLGRLLLRRRPLGSLDELVVVRWPS